MSCSRAVLSFFTLVIVVSATPARAQTLRWTKDGLYGTGNFGFALAGAGDVNGDGHDDVIVGDPDAQPFPFAPGQVWIYSGLDGTELRTFIGQTATVGIGLDVDGAGDVDDDGHADVVFTSAEDYPEVRSGLDGSLIREVNVVQPAGGQYVCRPGDLDGDGLEELAFGSIAYPNFTFRGRVYVIKGSWIATGAGASTLFTFDGQVDGSWFGQDVTVAGDTNADGFPDLIAGAPNETDGSYCGAAYVISGATGALLRKFKGGASCTQYGSHVASAGDVDEDGRDDVAIGAFLADANGSNSGTVVIRSVASGALLHSFDGDDANDMLGRGLEGGFDVDGDLSPDLLMGAGNDECSGSSRGQVHRFDASTDLATPFLCGLAASSFFGGNIASVGDIGGDGLTDFVVAATSYGGVGRIYVYESDCSGAIESYCPATQNSGGNAGELDAIGSTSISANDLALRARLCPPGQTGIFYYGSAETHAFVGDGYRCVGGATFRLNPPAQINQQGRASRVLDFTQPPLGSGAGEVTAGSTWNFQFWFRDPMGAGGGFNYTSALAIVFCP